MSYVLDYDDILDDVENEVYQEAWEYLPDVPNTEAFPGYAVEDEELACTAFNEPQDTDRWYGADGEPVAWEATGGPEEFQENTDCLSAREDGDEDNTDEYEYDDDEEDDDEEDSSDCVGYYYVPPFEDERGLYARGHDEFGAFTNSHADYVDYDERDPFEVSESLYL